MNKFFNIILIISIFICFNCDYKYDYINQRIKNPYLSSVSFIDNFTRCFGGGTIIRNEKGKKLLIITAAHIIVKMQEYGYELYISLPYEKKLKKLKLIKINQKLDLALLSSYNDVEKNGPYVRIYTKHPKIGDNVITIGCPEGKLRTVSEGIVSNIESSSKKYKISNIVSFGSSGGGVFNSSGKLIGIVSKLTIYGTSMIVKPGSGIVISTEDINRFIK